MAVKIFHNGKQLNPWVNAKGQVSKLHTIKCFIKNSFKPNVYALLLVGMIIIYFYK